MNILWWALTIFCGLAVLGGIGEVFRNPKGRRSSIVGTLIMVVLCVVFYNLTDSHPAHTDSKQASSPATQSSDKTSSVNHASSQDATKQTSDTSVIKVSGDNAAISGLAATSKESYDLMGKVVARNNIDEVKQMVANGELLMLPEGTKVLLVDRGLITTEAKITEGPYAGAEVWVPSEVVK